MLFTSLEFLFLFFPLTIGINFLLPKKFRNYWLLLTSLFFYAWGEPTFIIVMLGSILANYLLALRISEEKKHRRLILAIAIAFN
jgi:alginate O-acetyltransferase complex protein AlgI